jgi:hypothetical protein
LCLVNEWNAIINLQNDMVKNIQNRKKKKSIDFGLKKAESLQEKIRIIRDRMKTSQDRQKSYADRQKRPLEFNVGDRVYLKVAPWKHLLRIGMKGKLASRYIGSYEILKRIGPVAYQLALP